MSLNLITSKTLQTSFENMLLKLKEKHLGEHNIIIIPDKFSLNAEQLMFDILNIDVSFNIEVLSFSKLANIILEKQLKEKKIINKQISMLILSDVINENIDKLVYFKNVNLIDGFCEDIFNLISQMQTSDFNIENFSQFDELDKFKDIKLIYGKYLDALKDEKVDASKKFELFIEETKNSDFIKNSNFFFGMFYSLTPQMLKMTKEIMKYAKNTYFSCVSAENSLNKALYFDDLYKRLLKISSTLTKNVVVEHFKENLKPKFAHLLKRFSLSCKTQFNLKDDSVKLVESNDIESEVRACFSEIKFDIISKNLKFSDVAICCTNLEQYSNVIKKQQKLFNFNCFIDEEQKLDRIALIKFIINLSNCFEDENINNILTLLKSEFINLDENDKNAFEEFILKYNINEKNIFTKLNFYSDINFESYNKIFENFLVPLKEFINKQKVCENSHSYFANFNKYLNFLKIEEIVKEIVEKYTKQNDLLKAKQYAQLLTKIDEIFNNLETYLQNNFSIKRVNYFLKLLFSTSAVLTPPISVDSIFVGDLYNSYFHKFKNVYFLGCTSLNMPQSNTDHSLILEEENSEFKLNLEPNIFDINKLNKYKCFINLFNATDKIYLSYPKKSGNLNFKSSFITEIQKLFLKYDEPLKVNRDDIDNFEFLKPNAVANLIGLYCNNIQTLETEYLKSEGEYKQILFEILKHLNYTENEVVFDDFSDFKIDKLSVSKLEDYFNCPRKFMFKHLLKLKEKESLKLDLRTIGNIMHEAIKEFSSELNKVDENSVSKKANLIFKKILENEKYNFLKYQSENVILLETLKLEFIKFCKNYFAQQQNSNYKNALNEFGFRRNIGSYLFNGIADRIDVFEDNFIVIDYKTGSTKFSYSDIFVGKKIQLVLYAMFLEEILNKKCAGIFYLNLNDNFKKDIKAQNKMQGIVVNENNNIFKLDNSITENKGNIISDYFELSKKLIINKKEFDNLKDYCLNLLNEAIYNIESQKFDETPLKLTSSVGEICEYCEYKTICMNKNFKIKNSKNNEIEMIRIMKNEQDWIHKKSERCDWIFWF